MPFKKKSNKTDQGFDSITISLASPDEILERSYGEVLKPETINYRSYKPERDGLFCERIFGPVKDYEFYCGKYKRIRYKGIVCDRCGVEVTEKKVRRERMGHIRLVVPVVHIWFFKSLPNKIGYLLGVSSKKLETIVYYERYVVIQPGIKADEGISKMDLLTEEEYLEILDALPKENQMLDDSHPDKFVAKMGAEAVFSLLSTLNLDDLSALGKVITRPNTIALDGRLSTIFVGDTVRYVEQIQSSQNGVTVTTGKVDVGVTLNVVPRVSPDGTIAMNLNPNFTILKGFTPIPNNGQLPQTSTRSTTASTAGSTGTASQSGPWANRLYTRVVLRPSNEFREGTIPRSCSSRSRRRTSSAKRATSCTPCWTARTPSSKWSAPCSRCSAIVRRCCRSFRTC